MFAFDAVKDPIIAPAEVVDLVDAMIERQRRPDPSADLAFDEPGEDSSGGPPLIEADPSTTVH